MVRGRGKSLLLLLLLVFVFISSSTYFKLIGDEHQARIEMETYFTIEEYSPQLETTLQEHKQLNSNQKQHLQLPTPTLSLENLSVSVVIPVYNSEKYLPRCIETLQNQSLKTMEFIFVDDCSTDSSMRIIKEHALADPRIKLITNANNIGPGASRNVGIAAARGQYVGFLDPDDYLSPTFYEVLYNSTISLSPRRMRNITYDIVKGQLVQVNGNKTTYHEMVERSLTKRIYKYFFSQHYTAIYRRRMLELHPEARYGNSSLGEDLVFVTKIAFYARSMLFTNKAMYYYDVHKNSLSTTSGYKSLLAVYKSHKEMFDFCASSGDKAFYKDRAPWVKLLVDKDIAKYKRFETSNKPDERALYEEVKAFRNQIESFITN